MEHYFVVMYRNVNVNQFKPKLEHTQFGQFAPLNEYYYIITRCTSAFCRCSKENTRLTSYSFGKIFLHIISLLPMYII